MATDLDTPIATGEQMIKQKIGKIEMDLVDNVMRLEVVGFDAQDRRVYRRMYDREIFDDQGAVALPAAIAVPARDLFRAIQAAAKAQGWIGSGTDTDDL